MNVEDGKVVEFKQIVESEGQTLANWKRTILFQPGCLGEITYQAMLGISEGQKIAITDDSLLDIPYRDDFIQTIPLSQISTQILPIQKGMILNTQYQGKTLNATVVSLEKDKVTIDANHPWLGKRLNSQITIIKVINAEAGMRAEDVYRIESC